MRTRDPAFSAFLLGVLLATSLALLSLPVRAQSSPVTGMCTGGALGSAHDQPGVVCEDFDTDRNGSGSIEWTRLFPPAPVCDPLATPGDAGDDILGNSVHGGMFPFGVDGQICLEDSAFADALETCYVVPTENDWHLHSPLEGCDTDDSYDLGDPNFASSCAPDSRAHSGQRSLHLGRHLRPSDTLWDTYRLRQTSAFVMDPVHLDTGATLTFWQIIQVLDDNLSATYLQTNAGGQIQISLRDDATGVYQPWQRLDVAENDYNATANTTIVICEFDPGDDFLPPNNETMCSAGSPQWSDMGDVYGNDVTCTIDTDGNDSSGNFDCGETTNRTVDPSCSWVADPGCGSYLENGSVGSGVWARSDLDLSPFSGRQARLRWVFQGGGGWGFGESRSLLEPEPGFSPYFAYDVDAGWYVDDIRITNVLESVQVCVDPDQDGYGRGGNPACPAGIEPDCDCASGLTWPGAPEICDQMDNDCDGFLLAEEVDGDGDKVAPCQGDCNDADAANIVTPPPPTGLMATPSGNALLLSWDDLAPISGSDTDYDIFSGLISDLRSGVGFSAGSCEKNNVGSTSYSVHGPDPPLGDMRYFIVRGQNGCPVGDGSWGSPQRDAEIAASAMACN